MSEQALVPPPWQALYAPWAPASRRTFGWATPFILILLFRPQGLFGKKPT